MYADLFSVVNLGIKCAEAEAGKRQHCALSEVSTQSVAVSDMPQLPSLQRLQHSATMPFMKTNSSRTTPSPNFDLPVSI